MPQPFAGRKTLFAAVAICVGSFSVSHVSHAQPVTVNFNTLTESSPGSGTRFVSNCFMESGFVFTAVGVSCTGAAAANQFVAGNADSPLIGVGPTPSFLLNSTTATMVDITRFGVGAGLFNATSIMLAPFLGANTTVMFSGFGAAGTVMQSVMLSGTQTGFQTFTFASNFTNLNSLRITSSNQFGEPFVVFDNVSLNAVNQAVVPEPSTILLSAAGLAVLGFVARRRNHA